MRLLLRCTRNDKPGHRHCEECNDEAISLFYNLPKITAPYLESDCKSQTD